MKAKNLKINKWYKKMELSKTQKMLVCILKPILSEDQIIGVCLMLQHSEEAMIELGYLVATENLTGEQIVKKTLELYDNLPKELQLEEAQLDD